MINFAKSTCLFTCLLVLAGCDNLNRAVWSPDGSKLAILAVDGLRLSSSEGDLSKSFTGKKIESISWFSDSKKIAAVSEEVFDTWSSLKVKLSKEEAQQAIDAANTLMKTFRDDCPTNRQLGSTAATLSPDKLDKARLYMKEQYADELKSKLGKDWIAYRDSTVIMRNIEIYDLEPTFKLEKKLYETTNEIFDIRVSPDNSKIAFVENGDKTNFLNILLVSGDKPLTISKYSSDHPDWSADGRAIIFCQCENAQTIESVSGPIIGAITQAEIIDSMSGLREKAGTRKILAYIPFTKDIKTRCLKDGMIVFCAPELELPAIPNDMTGNVALFAVKPGILPNILRLSPRELQKDMADGISTFEISPDGHYAAMTAMGKDGYTHILDLHSGSSQKLDMKNLASPEDLCLLPQWKNNDELTFAAHIDTKPKNKHTADIVLWSVSKKTGKAISLNWPTSATKDFLQ